MQANALGAANAVGEVVTRSATEALGEQIAELAAHINAATYQLLVLIGEFDRQEGWASLGFRSTAHWLNWRIGADIVTARQKVRVARLLGELPQVSEAFRLGQLSYSKVRAICRIACEQSEGELVSLAKASTASQLERFVRAYRKADLAKENARADRQQQERYLQTITDDDGMLVISGRLCPEEGARLLKALELGAMKVKGDSAESLGGNCGIAESPMVKGDSAESPMVNAGSAESSMVKDDSEESSMVNADSAESSMVNADSAESPGPARRADALVMVAELALQNSEAVGHGGERYQVVVHVDAEVMADGREDGECRLEGGVCLAPSTVRRLGCDCGLVVMQHGEGGEVLDVGRKTRGISPGLRRALRHGQLMPSKILLGGNIFATDLRQGYLLLAPRSCVHREVTACCSRWTQTHIENLVANISFA